MISSVATIEKPVIIPTGPKVMPKAIPGFSVNVSLSQSPSRPIDRKGRIAIVNRTATFVAWSMTRIPAAIHNSFIFFLLRKKIIYIFFCFSFASMEISV